MILIHFFLSTKVIAKSINSFLLNKIFSKKVVKIIRNDGIAANAEQLLSMRDKRVYENQKMIENSKDNSYKAFVISYFFNFKMLNLDRI